MMFNSLIKSRRSRCPEDYDCAGIQLGPPSYYKRCHNAAVECGLDTDSTELSRDMAKASR